MKNKNHMEEASTNTNITQAVANRDVTHRSIINVAIAVIHYQQQYLLGFRNAAQHQGNRYEFVGGKIDSHETAVVALIREVAEETGIDIQHNQCIKLGRLHHDYGDKQVCLQVYKVALTAEQYKQHRHCDYGLEGQALNWVSKSQLLAGAYPLPTANKTILAWLQLPEQVVITYPLTEFNESIDIKDEWLVYHQQNIPEKSWVYIRSKASELENQVEKPNKLAAIQLTTALLHLRPDIYSILPYKEGAEHQYTGKLSIINEQIRAYHLTHHELMDWYGNFEQTASKETAYTEEGAKDSLLTDSFKDKFKANECFFSSKPLIISCHDIDSIHAANKLAELRVQHNLTPVIGIFLSPVLTTKTHPDSAPLGWRAWSALAQVADMPVIALGGLSPSLLQQAEQYGAVSIAGIRQFLQG